LFAAQLNCEDSGEVLGIAHEGEWLTAQQRLSFVCGWLGDQAISDALAETDEHRLTIRRCHGKARRIWVLSGSPRKREVTIWPECETCMAEVAHMRGAQRCPKCIQIQRREWKAEATVLWCKCKALGKSDFGTAWHIAKRLNLPLVTKAEEGVKGSGSGQGEGVIEFLIAEGLCSNPTEMTEYARRLRRGEEGGE